MFWHNLLLFLPHIELMKLVDMNINTAIKKINAAIHKRKVLELFYQTDDGNRMYFTVAPVCINEHDGKLYLEDGGQVCRVMMPELLQELGSLETLKDRNKIYALSDGVVQYNIKPDSPLPLKIGKGEEKEVNLYIGDSVEEGYPKEAILFIRNSRPASCRVTVN